MTLTFPQSFPAVQRILDQQFIMLTPKYRRFADELFVRYFIWNWINNCVQEKKIYSNGSSSGKKYEFKNFSPCRTSFAASPSPEPQLIQLMYPFMNLLIKFNCLQELTVFGVDVQTLMWDGLLPISGCAFASGSISGEFCEISNPQNLVTNWARNWWVSPHIITSEKKKMDASMKMVCIYFELGRRKNKCYLEPLIYAVNWPIQHHRRIGSTLRQVAQWAASILNEAKVMPTNYLTFFEEKRITT